MTTTTIKRTLTDDEKIAALEKKLNNLKKKANYTPVVEAPAKVQEYDYGDINIKPDEYVSIMSLLPYFLNLSTKEFGQGSVKKFTKFGEIKRVLYGDLVEIMENHKNFLEAGYFYILNPAIIRKHGLDDIYQKILTKEKIEEILTANSEECVALYNSANPQQQEIIVQLLTDKLRANPDSVNLNVIDKISRISKVDILKRVEDSRLLAEDTGK
jgi:hypothetical protein